MVCQALPSIDLIICCLGGRKDPVAMKHQAFPSHLAGFYSHIGAVPIQLNS